MHLTTSTIDTNNPMGHTMVNFVSTLFFSITPLTQPILSILGLNGVFLLQISRLELQYNKLKDELNSEQSKLVEERKKTEKNVRIFN